MLNQSSLIPRLSPPPNPPPPPPPPPPYAKVKQEGEAWLCECTCLTSRNVRSSPLQSLHVCVHPCTFCIMTLYMYMMADQNHILYLHIHSPETASEHSNVLGGRMPPDSSYLHILCLFDVSVTTPFPSLHSIASCASTSRRHWSLWTLYATSSTREHQWTSPAKSVSAELCIMAEL